MRLHIYSAGELAPVTHPSVGDATRFNEVLELVGEERLYFAGRDEEIDITLTVIEVTGTTSGHVIKHPCHHIAVKVSYGGHTVEVNAHPGTLASTIQERAIEKLGVDTNTATTLELRLHGQTTAVDLSKPVGVYVPAHECALHLDLAHINRPQG